MYTIHVPSFWSASTAQRLILRLKNVTSSKTISLKVSYGKPRQLDHDDLPGTDHTKIVAWVDIVENGRTSALTNRVRLSSLRRIRTIGKHFTSEGINVDAATLKDAVSLVNAWRWISLPNQANYTTIMSKNLMSMVKRYKYGETSFLSRIISELKNVHPINDGSEVVGQLLYVYFTTKIHSYVNMNNLFLPDWQKKYRPIHFMEIKSFINEINEYGSFITMRTLQASLFSALCTPVERIEHRQLETKSSKRGLAQSGLMAGRSTYGWPQIAKLTAPALEIIATVGEYREDDLPVVIYSANPAYLKSYLPRMLFYISCFPEVKYHLHIVGTREESLDTACLVSSHLTEINRIRGASDSKQYLEISYSDVPLGVSQHVTYYACARFLVAGEVMRRHQTSVWIQDVDLYPTGDYLKFVATLSEYDVALYQSNFLGGALPWVRYLAGNVFINTTNGGRAFIDAVQEYILSFSHVENSWMLDQNAMSFGIESLPVGSTVGDTRSLKIPVQQSQLAGRIEG